MCGVRGMTRVFCAMSHAPYHESYMGGGVLKMVLWLAPIAQRSEFK